MPPFQREAFALCRQSIVDTDLIDFHDRKFYEDGLSFSCTRCSNCCRHDPGYVFLSEADLNNLARNLKLDTDKVIRFYCREVEIGGFTRLSLKERRNFDCIFWNNHGCIVYEARPFQCKSYPFWSAHLDSRESWNALSDQCPGINQGELHSKEKIENWLSLRNREPFIDL